jgi:hypothetical protein
VQLIGTLIRMRCDTWSFTLREERRLRVLENRVQREIFGSNTDEVKLE